MSDETAISIITWSMLHIRLNTKGCSRDDLIEVITEIAHNKQHYMARTESAWNMLNSPYVKDTNKKHTAEVIEDITKFEAHYITNIRNGNIESYIKKDVYDVG